MAVQVDANGVPVASYDELKSQGDVNGDGVLSTEEWDALGIEGQNSSAWDLNGDGSVSADEAKSVSDAKFMEGDCPNVAKDPAGAARWLAMQASKTVVDLVVGAGNLVGIKGCEPQADLDVGGFAAADVDGDGSLTYEELLTVDPDLTPEQFQEISRGDKTVTRDDYNSYVGNYYNTIGTVGVVLEVAATVVGVFGCTAMACNPILCIAIGVIGVAGLFGDNSNPAVPAETAQEAEPK